MAKLDPPRPLAATVRPIDAPDRSRLLQEARGLARLFWKDPEHTFIGIGTAMVLDGHGPHPLADLRDRARAALAAIPVARDGPEAASPRFFGGVAFHDEPQRRAPWQHFPAARFWLPQRLLTGVQGRWYETTIQTQGEGTSVARAAEPRPAAAPAAPIAPAMDRAAWRRAVRDATDAIVAGDLAKVVLARSVRASPVADPASALDHADGRGAEATFLLEPVPGHALWGATPELLVALKDGRLQTHALAGSAPLGVDAAPPADAAGAMAGPAPASGDGHRLLRSEKDILEHELVVSFIREHLAGLGVRTAQSARRLRRLQTIQHMETPIEADGVHHHILDVVAALHPTPAVGGYPRQRSLALIRSLEPFPRGWYAGAVGHFDAAGDGRFAVALRCALSVPDATWLFAGAGIVAASDPDQEWQETEWKLAAMRDLLAGLEAKA